MAERIIGSLLVEVAFRPVEDAEGRKVPQAFIAKVEPTMHPRDRFALGMLLPEHLALAHVRAKIAHAAMSHAMGLLHAGKIDPSQRVTVKMPGAEVRSRFVTVEDLDPKAKP